MRQLELDNTNIHPFISRQEIDATRQQAASSLASLANGTARGSEYLGWLRLPATADKQQTSDLVNRANILRHRVETIVIIGIGGSYLGAKSVIEALSPPFDATRTTPRLVFAGHHLGEAYHASLLDYLSTRSFGICVISKSGTTTEPAITFRLLRALLERQVGKREASFRVIAITDKRRGALAGLAAREGYATFPIPDDIGGRYSVLTPVGLFPVALAGLDIRALLSGAAAMQAALLDNGDGGIALEYAAARAALYRKGYTTEITVNYDPRLHHACEWWKQLFGESEGKEGRGIFPATADFTTDLHSMGQYIQEGPRDIFETVISVDQTGATVTIPKDPLDLDDLNYLSGKRLDEVNKKAEQGTRMAHVEGGVPNIRLLLPRLDEYHLGELFYFYELSCGISAGILGVNAFDQPGVEAYKKNMFTLLGKP
jgi:glucose-6-phosphate isomerase